jgi:hypothetical protein
MLTKTYFYKRNLFALVPKAQLILPSYSLQKSYTLNSYPRDVLTKNLFTSLIPKSFQRFALLYSSSTSNIYYGRYTDLRPKDFWMKRLGTQYFSQLQPWMSTMTATIERESLHLIQKIFQQESTLGDKDFKSKEWVIRNDEDLNSLDLIGLIGNAQLFVLSYPYLTITKCAWYLDCLNNWFIWRGVAHMPFGNM